LKKNQSAVLAKYFSLYKKNPRSKVFAPLAESFRKLGMLDDALKILREGIRFHPNYTLGYIVLAHCYYDQERFDLTYNTLRPIIAHNKDNVSLQKIFAQACIHLGHLEEALDTYKYLLFMSPRDKFFAEQVKRLEDDLMVGHKKITLDQLIKAPETKLPEATESIDDDWVQVNFSSQDPAIEDHTKNKEESYSDQWEMRKTGLESHPILQSESIPKRSLEDDFYADEFEEEHGDAEEVNAGAISSDEPIVSHTLIDLYCSQHYYSKAIELLEKMIALNPKDESSQKKLEQVKAMARSYNPSASSEEDGHDELISIIENKVKVKTPQEQKLKVTYDHFLDALKSKSLHYR
jgi:pentatricopeptide repeat protein